MAGIIVKAAVSHEVDGLREANVNPEAPLDGDFNQPLGGRPAKGLVCGINHWVHKGSVIDADWSKGGNPEIVDLVKKVKVEMAKPGIPLNQIQHADGLEDVAGGVQQGGDEPKVVVKPIELKDFEAMIGTKKGGLGKVNKGYVRFAKTADGGLKLEKVGNKCGCFMNSRINVAPEHNRQMRQLFADTLLAEWGGAIAVGDDKDKYGAAVATVLSKVTKQILMGGEATPKPGKLLSRAEIKNCIDEYKSIFGNENVAKTFLDKCFNEFKYTRPDTATPTLGQFLEEYGKYAAEGYRTEQDLAKKIMACGNATEMIKVMGEISAEFDKMNAQWQIVRATKEALAQVQLSLTTGSKLFTANQLSIYASEILKKVNEDETLKSAKSGEQVRTFVLKVLPTYVRAARFEYANAVSQLDRNAADYGVKRAQEDAKFSEKMKFEAVLKAVSDFIKADNANEAKDPKAQILGMLQMRKDQLVAAFNQVCQSNPDMAEAEYGEKFAALQAQLDSLQKQMDEVENIQKEIDSRAAAALAKAKDEFVLLDQDGAKPRQWTEEDFGKVLADCMQGVPKDFAQKCFLAQYVAQNFQSAFNRLSHAMAKQVADDTARFRQLNGVDGEQPGEAAGNQQIEVKGLALNVDENIQFLDSTLEFPDCSAILKNAFDSVHAQIEEAVKLNLVPKDDISMGDFIGAITDMVLTSKIRGLMHTMSKTVGVDGKPIGSVTISVEGLIKAFVDRAKDDLLIKDRKLLESGEDIAAKFTTLLEVMSKKIANFKPKGKELDDFYTSIRAYHRQDVLKLGNLYNLNLANKDDMAKGVQIGMLKKFLANDLYGLLAFDQEDFGPELERHLELMLKETVAEISNAAFSRFYEGELNFDLGQVQISDEANRSLEQKTIKDPKTGFSNPWRVRDAFVKTTEGFEFQEKIGEYQAQSAFAPIAAESLKGLLVARAGDLWKHNVVQHAPGRGFSDSLDWVVYKFKGFMGWPKGVDISDKWIGKRVSQYEGELGKMLKGYFKFETKFVSVCRERLASALEASGNEWFATLKDPETKELFLNDLLGGFREQIQGVLERCIKAPKPFAEFLDDSKKLERFADKTLGLLPHGIDSDGFRRMNESLAVMADARMALIDGWAGGTKGARGTEEKLASFIAGKFGALGSDPSLSKAQRAFLSKLQEPAVFQSYGKDLLDWEAKRLGKAVLANPLNYYRPDREVFYMDLAKSMLDDMSKRFRDFGDFDAYGKFLEKLNAAEQTFAAAAGTSNELATVVATVKEYTKRTFIDNYGSIGRFSRKNGDDVDAAVGRAVAHFTNLVTIAQKAQADMLDSAFDQMFQSYTKGLDEIQAKMRAEGWMPYAIEQFVMEIDETFKAEYAKIENGVNNQGLKDEETRKALTQKTLEAANGVLTKMNAMYESCQRVFVAGCLNRTEKGVADLIAGTEGRALGASGYTDEDAYRQAVRECMASPLFTFLETSVQGLQVHYIQEVFQGKSFDEINEAMKARPAHAGGASDVSLGEFDKFYHEHAVQNMREHILASAGGLFEAAVKADGEDFTPEEIESCKAKVLEQMSAVLDEMELQNLRDSVRIVEGTGRYRGIISDAKTEKLKKMTLAEIKAELKDSVGIEGTDSIMIVKPNVFNLEAVKTTTVSPQTGVVYESYASVKDMTFAAELGKIYADVVAEQKLERRRVEWLDRNLVAFMDALLDNEELKVNEAMDEIEAEAMTQAREALAVKVEAYAREYVLGRLNPEKWDDCIKDAARMRQDFFQTIGMDAKLIRQQVEVFVATLRDRPAIEANAKTIAEMKDPLVKELGDAIVAFGTANLMVSVPYAKMFGGRGTRTVPFANAENVLAKFGIKALTPDEILNAYVRLNPDGNAKKEAEILRHALERLANGLAARQIKNWTETMRANNGHSLPADVQNGNLGPAVDAGLYGDKANGIFRKFSVVGSYRIAGESAGSKAEEGFYNYSLNEVMQKFAGVCKFLADVK